MFKKLSGYKKLLWWLGSLFLVIPVLLYTYFLMPFPGSQDTETIEFCYNLYRLVPFFTVTGVLFLTVPVIYSFLFATMRKRIMQAVWCLLLILFYGLIVKSFKAEEMFKEPSETLMVKSDQNKVSEESIVIGVYHNGEAKAYPVNYIGYHHKVQDSIGGIPVLVTYCTMCRTGRVYSPLVNGRYQQFRLVGARHYNAVIEDAETGTWWYQATGKAAAGKLKGQSLAEIPSQQMTLKAWLQKHSYSYIMQPDEKFTSEYDDLKEYDTKIRVGKDSIWQRKNWVVGVVIDTMARAYDWNYLKEVRLINDKIGKEQIIVFLENDLHSFHVWKAELENKNAFFKMTAGGNSVEDTVSGTVFGMNGKTFTALYIEDKLIPIQAYQEYWHSWKYFHPNTTQFSPSK